MASSTTRSDAEEQGGFSAAEKAAMKDRAKELRAAKSKTKVDPHVELREKIAAMADDDRRIAERLAEIVAEAAPDLVPKTYYGMVGWAKGGKVLVFFQDAGKFSTRYGTLGFNETAALDDGDLWPTSFAITALGDAEADRVRELVVRAVG
jgi:uncharacterized protein YdhG (YjbR/CyaY superfamily)